MTYYRIRYQLGATSCTYRSRRAAVRAYLNAVKEARKNRDMQMIYLESCLGSGRAWVIEEVPQ